MSNEATDLRPGDPVRLNHPADAREAEALYTVVELRGPRVLIRLVCDMNIPPTEAVMLSDVTRIEAESARRR